MDKYQITLSKEQLHTILQALELKARIGIGQFNEIWWQLEKRVTHDRSIESLGDMLAAKLGVKNAGMGADRVHPEVKRCWDIHQIFRKKWADDHIKRDSYHVWRNDPLLQSDVRLDPPTIVSLSSASPSPPACEEEEDVPIGIG